LGVRRLAAAALLAAAWGLLAPVGAEEPVASEEHAHARVEPARGGGALLLLSFLVPMPLPMALVAPPQVTRSPRPPADPCSSTPRVQACVAARHSDAK
jgi:hypothetical protein